MTRVVIADDQDMVRSGLRLILELGGIEVVGEASDGEEAVAAALEHLPDVVLMDLRMPHVDGIEATRRIVEARPETRVVLLSTYDADSLPAAASTCGAVRYVHKVDFSPAVLVEVRDSA